MNQVKNDAPDLRTAIEALQESQVKFHKGEISPLQHSRIREGHLSDAMIALGQQHGLTFQAPMLIDSRGEFSLVVMPKHGGDPKNGCGHYGEDFVKILNEHNPRPGAQTTKYMLPENGFCKINHFDVERMVVEQYNVQLRIEQANKAMEALTPDVSPAKKMSPK